MRRITRSMTKDPSRSCGNDAAAASTSTSHGVEVVEDNGNGSSSSSGSPMMTSSANTTQVNPLLMEDYLEKLFPYLKDRKSLTSVRLVNKAWNHTSAPVLKNALTWHVGPHENFKTSEQRFLKAMSRLSVEDRNRTFRNFTLKHKRLNLPKGGGCIGNQVGKFMKEFGPHMINLKIKSIHINYVRVHVKQTFLTNLEQLEFYDMSRSVLADPVLFDKTDLFTKVRSLCFNAHDEPWFIGEERGEGEGRICFNILKACPNLRELEINLRRTTLKIIRDVNSELNLASLTSFKNSLWDYETDDDAPSIVILRPLDFCYLVNKCPNLKVLSVNLSEVASRAEICQMLSNYSAQLEELYVSILPVYEYASDSDDSEGGEHHGEADGVRHPEWKSSSEESEEEEQTVRKRKRKVMKKLDKKKSKAKKSKKMGPASFPDFPLLRKLVMISWFYNDLDKLGSMPLLQEMDLRMKDGVALQLGSQQTASYPSVRSLKFRCAPHRNSLSRYDGDGEYCLEAPMVAPLISIFPNVTELDVEVADDEALRNLFRSVAGCGGGQLKRLHLNKSRISDSGITGIEWTDQLKMIHAKTGLSVNAWVAKYRRHPFIGLLTGLQELTYKGSKLTNLSVEFGLVSLKELTSLKLPSQKPREYRRNFGCCRRHNNVDRTKFVRSLVNVRALVDNLKYLVKLDVNDDSDLEEEERESREDDDEPEPTHDKFKGCGISVQDLGYIKEHAPSLDIVYSEIKNTP